jgi:hypothetical protein
MVCFFEILYILAKLFDRTRVALYVLSAIDRDMLYSALELSQLELFLSNNRFALLDLTVELLYVSVESAIETGLFLGYFL